MDKKELRGKIVLDLLLNQHKGEKVTSDLVKTIEKEFYQICGEVEKGEEGKQRGKSAADLFPH